MYKASGVLGLEMSDKLVALNGKPVEITGFMTPPLKAEAGFFVLTREPVSLCPFCNSDADWPSDIIVVYLRDGVRYTRQTVPSPCRARSKSAPSSMPRPALSVSCA